MPLVLVVVTITIFLIIRLTPGDPIQIMLGMQTSPEAVENLRAEFRLDQPWHMQYILWVGDLLQGDFGRSIRLNKPVTELLAERVPISLTLALGAMAFAVIVSIPLGMLAALKRNTWIDYVATGYTLFGFAVPNFAMAMILIYVFAIQLGWFPITGIGSSASSASGVWGIVRPYVLPAIALGTLQTAIFTRLLRSSLIDVLNQDYMRTAHAKGLKPATILVVHGLKNAMIPFITMMAILSAVVNRDFPVIQGFVFMIAVFFLLANILADILYTVVDPRVRY
jgi:peptide/nickel transport system permease protein